MGNAIKILILEHDVNDLELLQYALKKSELPYVSEIVETREAFEKALASFGPELILSDFSLPSFDGFTAFKIKEQQWPDIPFIVVSGTIGDENAVELIKTGVTDYVLKEKLYQLGPKIKRALAEAKARKQRKQAEISLKHREEQLHKIMTLSLDIIYTLDPEGRFVTVSPACKLILDYQPEELIGKSILDIVYEEDAPKLSEALAHLKYGIDIINLECRYVRKSGAIVTLLWSVRWHSDELGYGVAKEITEIKKAEEKIKLSEKRFRALLQNSTDGLTLLADDGTVIERSPAAQKLLGLGPEEVSGKFRTELVHPEDLIIIKQAIAEVKRAPEHIRAIEFRMVNPDGSIRWIEAILHNQLSEPAVKAIVLNFRDITERKLAELALRKNELILRKGEEIAHLGTWHVDLQTGSVYWSDEFFRILGLSPGEAEPSLDLYLSFLHPEDYPMVKSATEALGKTHQNNSIYQRIIRKDGAIRHLFADNKFEYNPESNEGLMFGALHDVTEKKQAEIKLQESEEKYRSLFELSPLPMWVFDVETYAFLNVNEAAIRHYGYSKEEFLNMTIKDIRPEADIEKMKQTVEANKITGAYFQMAVNHLKKNGELIQVELQSNLIDYGGKEGRLVLARDISERVKYIQAIEEQNKKLRDIAWKQSHVVRAPLARIMGLISVLENSSGQENDKSELTGHLMDSAYELDAVIRDIIKETDNVETASPS